MWPPSSSKGREPLAIPRSKRVFDVPGREPALIELHCQFLDLLRAPGQRLPDRRDVGLWRVARLRRGVVDGASPRLHRPAPITVPVALYPARGALVALTPERVRRLGVERLLHDQTDRKPHQLRPRGGAPKPSVDQRSKHLARPFRGKYSFDRDAPSGLRRQPAGPLLLLATNRVRPPPFPATLSHHPAQATTLGENAAHEPELLMCHCRHWSDDRLSR